MLVGISTPHKKSGLLFERYKKAPISVALPCRSSPRVPPDEARRCSNQAGEGTPAWGFRRRAALANMVIPREQQCYPRSVLPAEKFRRREGEST
jgi:hypothetical protein